MKHAWRFAALSTLVLLCGFTCVSSNPTASTSPSSTTSTRSTPTSTPTSSPTSTTTTPASTPSSTATPPGSTLAITSLPFHNGEVGIGYLAVTLGATGGTPAYAWSIGGGTFPPGLKLSASGSVTGNNTAAGTFSFTVTVTDSTGATTSKGTSLRVYPALAVTQPCAGLCNVEEGCTVCGGFGSATGGLPPYHYAIITDNRPTGMGLSGLSLTGTFPAPGPVGQFNLTMQVTDDQFGATRTVTANWAVFSHINFTGANSYPCGNSPSSCSLQITYTGGTPGGSPTVKVVSVGPIQGVFTGPPPPASMTVPVPPVTSQCFPNKQVVPTGLPPGSGVTSGGGVVTLNLGPPDQTTYCGFTAEVTIVLVDQSPCGPGNCTTTTAVTIEISI